MNAQAKTLKKIGSNSVFILLTAALIYYYVEAIYWQSFSMALDFIFHNADFKVHFMNLCIVGIFELAVYLFSNNYSVSFGITALFSCILAIVNELKMFTRGEAFTFGDISVTKEALLVAGNYDLKISNVDIKIILLIIFLMIILILFEKIKNQEMKNIEKNKKITIVQKVCGLTCTGILLLCWNHSEYIIEFIKGHDDFIYIVSTYYDENGLLLGLARTAPHKMRAPDRYSKKAIMEIQENVQLNNNIESGIQPNIIFIMNESLYDLQELGGVTFSKDPLGKLKELQEKYTFGTLISPMYGGGTCNVEFEVITGCPIEELESNALPYSNMIHNNIPSLVSLLNYSGYFTTAFHPHIGSYFKRRDVYSYMQFAEAYFSEEMGIFPPEGQYASDLELYKYIINKYESQPADIPFFSYVITMQNHGGYDYEYDSCGISVLDSNKFRNERTLKTFANLECSSIDAFEYLIKYFNEINDPTVIVMFGDHAPGLSGFDYQFESDEDTGMLKFRSTLLIVYSNYDLPYEEWGYVNSYNLASKVLEYCGIKRDTFFEYQLQSLNVPSLKDEYYINSEWVEGDLADTMYDEYKYNRWLLCYDRVFGKRYGIENNE